MADGARAGRRLARLVNERLLRRAGLQLVRRVRLEELGAAAHAPDFPGGTWVLAEPEPGLRLWVDLGDRGVSLHCLNGTYEPSETRFVRDTLSVGARFVDVGANIGWFALNAARIVGPEGRVFAFEPRADSVARLAASVAENGFTDRVSVFPCALADRPGRLKIGWARGTDNPGGTWLMASEALLAAHRDDALQETEVRTLDEALDGADVDLIKMDVEGAEHLVVRGGIETLRRCRPPILAELSFETLPLVSGVTAEEFVAALAAEGYRCRRLADGRPGPNYAPEPRDVAAGWVSVVFLPA